MTQYTTTPTVRTAEAEVATAHGTTRQPEAEIIRRGGSGCGRRSSITS